MDTWAVASVPTSKHLNSIQNPKDIPFSILCDKTKQQIVPFEKLKPAKLLSKYLSFTTGDFRLSFSALQFSCLSSQKLLGRGDCGFLSQHTQQLTLQHVTHWQQHNGRLCQKQKNNMSNHSLLSTRATVET